MSIRLEMLQLARLAPKLLGDSTELVRSFFRRQQNEDGGFKDRAGQSDLYYTVFALEGLIALQEEAATFNLKGETSNVQHETFNVQRSTPNVQHSASNVQHSTLKDESGIGDEVVIFEKARKYLTRFADGEGLDFVHLCCLARGWASLNTFKANPQRAELLDRDASQRLWERIESHRSQNGGYHPIAGAKFGTAYAAFLAMAAYQDLQTQMPEPLRLASSLRPLETPDGAWTNEVLAQAPSPHSALPAPPTAFRTPQSLLLPPHSKVGATNATAAVVTLLRQLNAPIAPTVGKWLLSRAHPQGGFLAVPNAPIPDLLSTATALHALAGLQLPFEDLKEPCLDFVDSLWTNEGGFYGHWHEDHLDCEYTYYGLLTLGHLSL